MGDRLTEAKPKQTSQTPYGDIFDELEPHYLAMGMSYYDYWEGESRMKRAFRKAFAIRVENEQRIADRNNWYMGQYILSALQSVPLLVAGLNVKRGTKLPEYPDKPFFEKFEANKNAEVRKKNQEDQTRLAMAMFQAGIEKFNRNFQKRQEQKDKAVGTGQ